MESLSQVLAKQHGLNASRQREEFCSGDERFFASVFFQPRRTLSLLHTPLHTPRSVRLLVISTSGGLKEYPDMWETDTG